MALPKLRPHALFLASAFFLMGSLATVEAATININNVDSPGEGFNDPSLAAPVGGNTGTTIGQQRLIVFQKAASIWGSILPSTVEIIVDASFDPLSCTSTSAVLGSAGATFIFHDFPGAIRPGTWYVKALANRLAGSDQLPSSHDIVAHFNSNLGNPGCFDGVHFYYGLDDNHGSDVDLLPVVLHELGHGLGFLSTADKSTGVLPAGLPDIYTHFILDTGTGKHWDEMTDGERATSALNCVVWDGQAVTRLAPSFLGHRPSAIVHSPGAVAGSYYASKAFFGAPLNDFGVTADIELAIDDTDPTSDACTALLNDLTGKIAMIDRGSCTFVSKVKAAQDAGAIGAIIVNNVSGCPILMGGSDPSIAIPALMVSLDDGNAIKAHLGDGVNVTMGLDAAHLAGANNDGKVALFGVNPVSAGSSISHWDRSAFPDLLMEPVISDGLGQDVDLTRHLFIDIGWFGNVTGVEGQRPVAAALSNAPNPFAVSTAIEFNVARSGVAELDVIDMSGRLVKRLANAWMPQGSHTIAWDGTDRAGRKMAPGVYLYRLKSGDTSQSHRMVLVH